MPLLIQDPCKVKINKALAMDQLGYESETVTMGFLKYGYKVSMSKQTCPKQLICEECSHSNFRRLSDLELRKAFQMVFLLRLP